MSSLHRLVHDASPCTRRELLGAVARTAFGVTALAALGPLQALLAGEPPRLRRPARACIYLYMGGGMSHLDTFDPKPGHADAGPVKAVVTNVDQLRISEYLPLLAKQADKLCLLRSSTPPSVRGRRTCSAGPILRCRPTSRSAAAATTPAPGSWNRAWPPCRSATRSRVCQTAAVPIP